MPKRDSRGFVTNYGSLPLHAWHEIDGTRLAKLLPRLPQSNANDLNNVMANWGSSSNDPATGDMHLHGGAHGANAQNSGWYTFNTRKADWRITVPPLYMGAAETDYLNRGAALINSDPWSGSYNIGMPPEYIFLPVPGSVTGAPTLATPNATSSGKVVAHHCWHKLAWVSWIGTGRVFCSTLSMYLLDPATGNVTAIRRYNDTNFQNNVADVVTRRIYGLTNSHVSDYWGFREYDPVADKIVAEYRVNLAPATQYHFNDSNAQCVVGSEIFFLQRVRVQGLFAFDMDRKTWRAIVMSQGKLMEESKKGEFCMVYISEIGKIVGCQSWGKLWQIDPNSGAVELFPTQGPMEFAAAPNNGLFGRLHYQDKLLFAIDWATSNVKVMRMQ